ncbi:hypothetical protein BGX23_002545, partial [Mortierella sp. AD031]
MMQVHDYTFLFGIGLFFAFMDAYGIGANDVANSFATSVGSGSITLAQALIIACFCEFGGAFFLGANTTETIKGGIVDPQKYVDTPEHAYDADHSFFSLLFLICTTLKLTMVCALIGSSTWVLFATSRGWPVSTTHAIVGAITGAGVSAFGVDGIQWGGIRNIVLSWVISPVAAGFVCSLFFLFTKHVVLKHDDSFRRGLIAIPAYFGVAIMINIFYIIFKGAPASNLRTASIGIPVGIAVGTGFVVFLWCLFFLSPFLRRKIQDEEDLKWYHLFYIPFVSKREKPAVHAEETSQTSAEKLNSDSTDFADAQANPSLVALEKSENSFFKKLKSTVFAGLYKDLNSHEENDHVNKVHANATKFDSDTERLFSAVQVITACFTSFAHGSND